MLQSYQPEQGGSSPSAPLFKNAPPANQLGAIVVSGWKLHTALSELQAPAYGLWAYLRGLDKSGSGCAIVGLEQICQALSCKPSTVYRWLKQGLGHWFRSWTNLGANQFRIYYRSITIICCERQINDLGAIAWVKPHELTRSGRKVVSAELETALAQHQAYYALKSKLEGAERDKLKNPSILVYDRSSEFSTGARRSHRFLVIRPDAPEIPHTTIGLLGGRLGICYRAAQNRLSNTWRAKKGFEPLDRLQVMRRFDEQETQAYKRCCAVHNNTQEGFNNLSGTKQAIIAYQGGFCWAGGNIYNPQVELKSSRFQRSRIKQAVARSNALVKQSFGG
jgi:hypothetical protein